MRVLGIDSGIASIGWAVIEVNSNITDAGVWTWQAPEEIEKNKRTSHRRVHGSTLRRVKQVKRRRQRLNAIRNLFVEFGLLPIITKQQFKHALEVANQSPWKLRIEALDHRLDNAELAAALYYLAGHRAYLSNAKTKKNDPAQDERKKVLAALERNERDFNEALVSGQVRTVGEWMGGRDKKRNHAGDYSHSIRRVWIQQEAARLIACQRNSGNLLLSEEFGRKYATLAFEQRPVAAQEVGKCTLEINDPRPDRSPRHAYSFEYFRFLQKLNDLRLIGFNQDVSQPLNADQVRAVATKFGTKTKIRFADIRKWLSIPDSLQFKGCADAEAEKLDIVAGKGVCCPGYWALKKTIVDKHGDVIWQQISKDVDCIDGIAAAIAHRDDLVEITNELRKLPLDTAVVETLTAEANGGELGFYKGTGRISLIAARKLIQHMENGLDYHKAQIEVYGERRDRTSNMPEISGNGIKAVREWLKTNDIESKVGSDVASRAIRQIFRQVIALLEERNQPHRPNYRDISVIRLEMARDIGRGAEARDKISMRQAQDRNRKIELEASFNETFHREPSDPEFERWILFSEQNGTCAYTFEQIQCRSVLDGENSVQVDHILPRSRFGIDSYVNKVLCFTNANQNKQDQTPYEWKRGDGLEAWEGFCVRARGVFKNNQKKLEYLLATDTSKLPRGLAERYLNDTRWIGRFVLTGLKSFSTPEWPISVEPVNAGLVALLRHAWGLDVWKRDPTDPKRRRSDDRHHALDAAITAVIDKSLVQALTHACQHAEKTGQYFPARNFRRPWQRFSEDLLTEVYGSRAVIEGHKRFIPNTEEGVFVARSESRRPSGKLHSDNARSVEKVDGSLRQFRNVAIENLKVGDLANLKDANQNRRMVELLKPWIEAGSKPENAPQWNVAKKGMPPVLKPIKSVPIMMSDLPRFWPDRLIEKNPESHRRKVGEPFASVDPESIVRLDIFKNEGDQYKAKYLYVPVYSHQMAAAAPPKKMFLGSKSISEWPDIPNENWFLFSLWPCNLIEVEYRGEVHIGYYKKFHSGDGRIYINWHYQSEDKLQKTFSPSLIQSLKKLSIDRLGNRNLINSEKRTWRKVK